MSRLMWLDRSAVVQRALKRCVCCGGEFGKLPSHHRSMHYLALDLHLRRSADVALVLVGRLQWDRTHISCMPV